jgi:hypothetical protein
MNGEKAMKADSGSSRRPQDDKAAKARHADQETSAEKKERKRAGADTARISHISQQAAQHMPADYDPDDPAAK